MHDPVATSFRPLLACSPANARRRASGRLATTMMVVSVFGLLIIARTADLRRSVSLGALIFGPAAAFSGVTFPLSAMPLGARMWAEALPLTHALALVRAGITVGAPEAATRCSGITSWP